MERRQHGKSSKGLSWATGIESNFQESHGEGTGHPGGGRSVEEAHTCRKEDAWKNSVECSCSAAISRASCDSTVSMYRLYPSRRVRRCSSSSVLRTSCHVSRLQTF